MSWAGRGRPEAGLVGLGRMGLAMAERLTRSGWRVVAHDRSAEARHGAAGLGVEVGASLAEMVSSLRRQPRLVWLMLPSGQAVDEVIFGASGTGGLAAALEAGDVVIDGGNSWWRDSQRRARDLALRGIYLLDCGSSGGVEGARRGMCLMVGGDPVAFATARPLLEALAEPGGMAHVGPSGAGHYVKMVHNAIEYGMLEAIGEGFELLDRGPFELDLAQIAHLWSHGSVIRGWLIELLARALDADPRLASIRGVVGGGETGQWAIQEAWQAGVPFPAIAMAYAMRLRSRQGDSVAARVVAALRREFGQHATVPSEPADDFRPGGQGR